ncbi:DNA-binding response OmpR family regulator [Kroppenstedtia sanguinis]|uniref:winged helix-turn-helix domain-containing protein n=1 Tax=Kroppenstedtia sanguinis TaxID=1380684 RepID=UPI003D2014DA
MENKHIILYSGNTWLIQLITHLFQHDGIQVVVVKSPMDIKPALTKKGCISLMLDFPEPDESDFHLWKELSHDCKVAILIFSSNNQTVSHFVTRENAAIFMHTPLSKLFQALYPGQKTIRLNSDTFFDIAGHCIDKRGERSHLSTIEFKLLYLLTLHRGQAVSSTDLIQDAELPDLNSLYVYISKLREKVEDSPKRPKILVTERGVGYKIL